MDPTEKYLMYTCMHGFLAVSMTPTPLSLILIIAKYYLWKTSSIYILPCREKPTYDRKNYSTHFHKHGFKIFN